MKLNSKEQQQKPDSKEFSTWNRPKKNPHDEEKVEEKEEEEEMKTTAPQKKNSKCNVNFDSLLMF